MRELYEDFKRMLIENQKEVMYKKEMFNSGIKATTKDARQYLIQLTQYGEEINRNINTINRRLQNLKEE